MIGKKSRKLSVPRWTAVILLSLVAGCSSGNKSVSTDKHLQAGEEWIVSDTLHLTALTIAEGAVVRAPEGRSVTLTIDGVETGIAPGAYRGDIVLTITEEIPITFRNFPEPHLYRTAVYVENGKYVPEKSVAAAVARGTATDALAENIKITSIGENFNGIMATGDTTFSYTIVKPDIDFSGNGGNDFAGWGAAIMSSGKAEVTVEGARIVTRGAVRTAVWAGGNSTMHVNDSDIEVFNGVLPADYTFSADPGKMKEAPWPLGITGNCRATNVVDGGAAYYRNTRIKAQAWGALSTDGTRNGILHVTDCKIETVESGYGAYADGSVEDYFSGCTFNVNDYGLIMTGGEGIFTDGCEVNSGRFGVMFHGAATLTVEKGTVFNTGKAVLQVKSAFPTITVDGAVLNSGNGIILQSMVNDDPIKAAMPGGGIPGAGAAGEMPPGGGMPGGVGGMPEGMPEGGMPEMAMGGSGDITAVFRNMALNGDVIHAMTSLADMNVSFENASITGAVTMATAKARADIDGVSLSQETCSYIGEVDHTFLNPEDEHGMSVALDGNSTWVVDETSYLTRLMVEEGGVVKAPEGKTMVMTLDGLETEVKPGSYTGAIVIGVQ